MGGSGGRWVLRIGTYIRHTMYTSVVDVLVWCKYRKGACYIQKLEIRIWLLCHNYTYWRYDMKNKYKRCAGIVMMEYTDRRFM